MKLSLVDKTLLLRWGYQTADFPQIEVAMQSRNTKYTLDRQTIPRQRQSRFWDASNS